MKGSKSSAGKGDEKKKTIARRNRSGQWHALCALSELSWAVTHDADLGAVCLRSPDEANAMDQSWLFKPSDFPAFFPPCFSWSEQPLHVHAEGTSPLYVERAAYGR